MTTSFPIEMSVSFPPEMSRRSGADVDFNMEAKNEGDGLTPRSTKSMTPAALQITPQAVTMARSAAKRQSPSKWTAGTYSRTQLTTTAGSCTSIDTKNGVEPASGDYNLIAPGNQPNSQEALQDSLVAYQSLSCQDDSCLTPSQTSSDGTNSQLMNGVHSLKHSRDDKNEFCGANSGRLDSLRLTESTTSSGGSRLNACPTDLMSLLECPSMHAALLELQPFGGSGNRSSEKHHGTDSPLLFGPAQSTNVCSRPELSGEKFEDERRAEGGKFPYANTFQALQRNNDAEFRRLVAAAYGTILNEQPGPFMSSDLQNSANHNLPYAPLTQESAKIEDPNFDRRFPHNGACHTEGKQSEELPEGLRKDTEPGDDFLDAENVDCSAFVKSVTQLLNDDKGSSWDPLAFLTAPNQQCLVDSLANNKLLELNSATRCGSGPFQLQQPNHVDKTSPLPGGFLEAPPKQQLQNNDLPLKSQSFVPQERRDHESMNTNFQGFDRLDFSQFSDALENAFGNGPSSIVVEPASPIISPVLQSDDQAGFYRPPAFNPSSADAVVESFLAGNWGWPAPSVSNTLQSHTGLAPSGKETRCAAAESNLTAVSPTSRRFLESESQDCKTPSFPRKQKQPIPPRGHNLPSNHYNQLQSSYSQPTSVTCDGRNICTNADATQEPLQIPNHETSSLQRVAPYDVQMPFEDSSFGVFNSKLSGTSAINGQVPTGANANMSRIGGRHFSAPIVLAHPDEFCNPSSFLKVYGDPLCGGSDRKSIIASGQNGNWRCARCGNVNYPRRFRCNKCSEARDTAGDQIVSDYAFAVYQHHLRTYRRMGGTNGWLSTDHTENGQPQQEPVLRTTSSAASQQTNSLTQQPSIYPVSMKHFPSQCLLPTGDQENAENTACSIGLGTANKQNHGVRTNDDLFLSGSELLRSNSGSDKRLDSSGSCLRRWPSWQHPPPQHPPHGQHSPDILCEWTRRPPIPGCSTGQTDNGRGGQAKSNLRTTQLASTSHIAPRFASQVTQPGPFYSPENKFGPGKAHTPWKAPSTLARSNAVTRSTVMNTESTPQDSGEPLKNAPQDPRWGEYRQPFNVEKVDKCPPSTLDYEDPIATKESSDESHEMSSSTNVSQIEKNSAQDGASTTAELLNLDASASEQQSQQKNEPPKQTLTTTPGLSNVTKNRSDKSSMSRSSGKTSSGAASASRTRPRNPWLTESGTGGAAAKFFAESIRTPETTNLTSTKTAGSTVNNGGGAFVESIPKLPLSTLIDEAIEDGGGEWNQYSRRRSGTARKKHLVTSEGPVRGRPKGDKKPRNVDEALSFKKASPGIQKPGFGTFINEKSFPSIGTEPFKISLHSNQAFYNSRF